MNQVSTLAAPMKHCEHCGKQSPEAKYFFIAESRLIIFLKSRHVVEHNAMAKIVTLSDGQALEYDSVNGDTAYKFKPGLIPHILCGLPCAMDLAKQRIHYSKELLDQTPFIDCGDKDRPLWDPIPLMPSNIKYNTPNCTICGRAFPNLHKRFEVQRIMESRVVDGVLGQVAMPAGFNIGHGDATKARPRGRFWFYRADENGDFTPQFCSDECTYKHAQKTNSVILFPNRVMNGYITMITPATQEANKGLGVAYPYRPQKMRPIPT